MLSDDDFQYEITSSSKGSTINQQHLEIKINQFSKKDEYHSNSPSKHTKKSKNTSPKNLHKSKPFKFISKSNIKSINSPNSKSFPSNDSHNEIKKSFFLDETNQLVNVNSKKIDNYIDKIEEVIQKMKTNCEKSIKLSSQSTQSIDDDQSNEIDINNKQIRSKNSNGSRVTFDTEVNNEDNGSLNSAVKFDSNFSGQNNLNENIKKIDKEYNFQLPKKQQNNRQKNTNYINKCSTYSNLYSEKEINSSNSTFNLEQIKYSKINLNSSQPLITINKKNESQYSHKKLENSKKQLIYSFKYLFKLNKILTELKKHMIKIQSLLNEKQSKLELILENYKLLNNSKNKNELIQSEFHLNESKIHLNESQFNFNGLENLLIESQQHLTESAKILKRQQVKKEQLRGARKHLKKSQIYLNETLNQFGESLSHLSSSYKQLNMVHINIEDPTETLNKLSEHQSKEKIHVNSNNNNKNFQGQKIGLLKEKDNFETNSNDQLQNLLSESLKYISDSQQFLSESQKYFDENEDDQKLCIPNLSKKELEQNNDSLIMKRQIANSVNDKQEEDQLIGFDENFLIFKIILDDNGKNNNQIQSSTKNQINHEDDCIALSKPNEKLNEEKQNEMLIIELDEQNNPINNQSNDKTQKIKTTILEKSLVKNQDETDNNLLYSKDIKQKNNINNELSNQNLNNKLCNSQTQTDPQVNKMNFIFTTNEIFSKIPDEDKRNEFTKLKHINYLNNISNNHPKTDENESNLIQDQQKKISIKNESNEIKTQKNSFDQSNRNNITISQISINDNKEIEENKASSIFLQIQNETNQKNQIQNKNKKNEDKIEEMQSNILRNLNEIKKDKSIINQNLALEKEIKSHKIIQNNLSIENHSNNTNNLNEIEKKSSQLETSNNNTEIKLKSAENNKNGNISIQLEKHITLSSKEQNELNNNETKLIQQLIDQNDEKNIEDMNEGQNNLFIKNKINVNSYEYNEPNVDVPNHILLKENESVIPNQVLIEK